MTPVEIAQTAARIQAAARAEEAQQERLAQEQLAVQIQILTTAFDKAAAYTNLLILGAYAGFFGLWQLSKEHLSKQDALWSALLVFTSLIFLVVFEVVKMSVVQQEIATKSKALKSPETESNPRLVLQKLRDISTAHERVGMRLMTFWRVTMAVTVSTGLVGAASPIKAFILALTK